MCPPHSHNWLCPQIYFWEAQRRNLTERVKTLFLAENGVKLKNLTGYTTYMVSVAAFNAAGDGPRTPPTRGQTQQAGGGERQEGRAVGGTCAPGAGGVVGVAVLSAEMSGLDTQAPQDGLQRWRAQPKKRGLHERAQKTEAVPREPWREPPDVPSPPHIL